MEDILFLKTYAAPAWNKAEILRYAGVKEPSEEIGALLDECMKELKRETPYKVVYRVYPVAFREDGVFVGPLFLSSQSLKKNLSGCSRAVLFAATVGLEIDRLIKRYTHTSSAKALLFQALGAERIESLCDVFEEDVARTVGETCPRFSPGYGDLPLAVQKDIFALLTPEKTIGLSLTESLLMAPSKSVTAFIGIKNK